LKWDLRVTSPLDHVSPDHRRRSAGAAAVDEGPAALAQDVPSGSQAMVHALELLGTVARVDVPVLLEGEVGTGKSWLARSLHTASARRAAPFVRLDCLSLSLSSSTQQLSSAVALARDGTLFLQEVWALPGPLQVTLSSLLEQERQALPSLRAVTSSSRDLEGAVRAGLFLRELLDLLDVVEVAVPPLRNRREDVLPLAEHFLSLLARQAGLPAPLLGAEAQGALLAYSWPGNVSELRSAMHRALLMARGSPLELDALPPRVAGAHR
jgi:DNA-binding NtrC family response regulator